MFSSLYSHRKNSRNTRRPPKLAISRSKDSDHAWISLKVKELISSLSLWEKSSVGLGGFTLKPTSHSTMDQAEPILGVSSGMWHSGCLSCQAPSDHVHQPGVKGLKRREEEEEDRTKVSRPLGGRMTEDRISQEVRSSTATGCHS